MNAPLHLSVGEPPSGLIADRMAAAYAFADAVRSAYLTRCCKQDFKQEEKHAEWIEKARVTRERNAELRRQMMMSATIGRAP